MKNKILPILCIFILFSCIFINSCFASDTSDFSWTYNDYTYNLPNLRNSVNTTYGLIITGEEYKYFRIVELLDYPSDNSIHIASTYGGSFSYYTSSGALGKYNVWAYDLEKGTLKLEYTEVDNWDWSLHYPTLYSTYDIYDTNGTDIFFQKAPVPPTTLAGVLEATNPTEVFKNLMKNVVVSLIVFLVGFLTFSKAWAWLKTQLSKA